MPKPKISNPVSRLVINRNRNLNRNRNTETPKPKISNHVSRLIIIFFSSQSTSQETDEKANYEGGELDNAQEIPGESIFITQNIYHITSLYSWVNKFIRDRLSIFYLVLTIDIEFINLSST